MSTVDLPERVTVNVTLLDIENGKPGDPRSCPVALAVTRTLDLGLEWIVDVGSTDSAIEVFRDGAHDEVDTTFYRVPEDEELMYSRIVRFDDGEGMEPFEFEMRR